MKTLLLLVLLIVASYIAKAEDLPLLNLEIGKTYHIETVRHTDTTQLWPRRVWDYKKWEFTPESYNPLTKTYKMKVVLDFYQHVVQEKFSYRGWMESEVYESGYLGSYRSPIVYMNAYRIPVYFTLSKERAVSSVDFSAIKNHYTPEGQSLDIYADYGRSFSGYLHFIFLSFISKDASKGREEGLSPMSGNSKETNETIILDSLIVGKYMSFRRFVNNDIVIDKKTGLVLKKRINTMVKHRDISGKPLDDNVWNPSVEYQRYIPEYETNFPVVTFNRAGTRVDTVITKYNFILEGILMNRIEGQDSIGFSCSDQGISAKLPLDSANHFRMEFLLDKSSQVRLIYPMINIDKQEINFEVMEKAQKSFCALAVDPGDSLFVELESEEYLNINDVSGFGNLSYNKDMNMLRNRMTTEFLSSKRLTNEFRARVVEVLDRDRSQISPQVYINATNDLTYFNNRVEKLDSSYTDRLLVNNTLAKNSSHYLNFLYYFVDNLLDSKISMETGVDNYNFSADKENLYYVGQIALSEPVRSYFLAYYLRRLISERSWALSERLFESYQSNYEDKPVFEKLNEFYNEYQKIAPGHAAPDFTITGLDGEVLTNSDLKKQVTLLFFYSKMAYSIVPNRKSYFKAVADIYKQISEEYPQKLSYLLVYEGTTDIAKEIKKELPEEIEVYTETGSSNKRIFSDYKINSSSQHYFLIDRNGNIAYNNPQWYSYQLPWPEVEKALAVPYESENEFPVWLRITLIALIGALIAVVFTFILYRSITRRRLAKSELNKKMRELELTAIRAQMNPHFMYNCLNSIQNLVQKKQNEEAHLYLSKFASLIRRTLNTSKKDEISLAAELETIQEYIDLEKLRFEFDYVLNMEETVEINSVFVPPMLLQPFVENALLHGLLPKSAPRILSITLYRKDKEICIDVEDNGVGRQKAGTNGSSGNKQGLKLSAERLNLLEQKYKAGYHFEIIDLTDEIGMPSGTRVRLCFTDE